MNRRSFVFSGFSAVTASASRLASSEANKRAWLELKFFRLRNDLDRSRLERFLREGFLPALKRIGRSPVGIFNVTVGSQMPVLMTLSSYPSLAQMESDWEEQSRNAAWNKALDELDQPQMMAYVRIESVLLSMYHSLVQGHPQPQRMAVSSGPQSAPQRAGAPC